MLITRTSIQSGLTRTMDLDISPEQWAAFQAGDHIQDAMPHLSDSEREFILTGMTDEEWDALRDAEDDDGLGDLDAEAAF